MPVGMRTGMWMFITFAVVLDHDALSIDGKSYGNVGGRNMMLKDGLRKGHISMVDWMNSHGGRNGESIMMEEDQF